LRSAVVTHPFGLRARCRSRTPGSAAYGYVLRPRRWYPSEVVAVEQVEGVADACAVALVHAERVVVRSLDLVSRNRAAHDGCEGRMASAQVAPLRIARRFEEAGVDHEDRSAAIFRADTLGVRCVADRAETAPGPHQRALDTELLVG